MNRLLYCVLILACQSFLTHATEISVLSAGAVEPGMHAFADQVKRQLGHDLKIRFNTAPQIAKRLADGENYDILVSPPAVIDQAIQDGKAISEGRSRVGRVGAGVAVRNSVASPDITTVESLKKALLDSDSLVYNTASTGIYLDKLFANMGILEQLRPKTTRYANGAAVLEHLIDGKGNEIGFGALTEIRLYTSKGLKLVGPLPSEVQNYTSYEAAMMKSASDPEAARAVLNLLASPSSRAVFTATGID